MRKPGISQTRQRILQFIRDFVDYRGYSPTVRDILKGCGLSSTAVVQHHLNVLDREGFIQRDARVFRSIKLREKINLTRVPLLGSIAAGEPIPVPASDIWRGEALGSIDLTELTQGKEVYGLRVKGLSMVDAFINDGDVVLMQPASTADNGDMVAVWLKDRQEVTLKRFFREPDRIRLQPANSQMAPLYVDPENLEIQGKVIGVVRRL